MDLDAVTGELYGVAPGDFVEVRDERAAQARRAGERELAEAIKKLRRPSAGAWLANLLVRERHEQVSKLLAVGEELREAQARLANEDLRRLSKERRRAVASLAGEALELARERGQTVSSAAARELEATLEAALLDAAAADELEAGRLTVALGYTGLGWAGPDGALLEGPGGTPLGPPGPEQRRPGARTDAGKADNGGLVAARAALATAQAAVAAAGREVDEHRGQAQQALRERDRQHQKVADLEEQMTLARAGEQQAEHQLRHAQDRLGEAEDRLAEAEDRARSAQGELDKAKDGHTSEGAAP
jgi:hypothetical protein